MLIIFFTDKENREKTVLGASNSAVNIKRQTISKNFLFFVTIKVIGISKNADRWIWININKRKHRAIIFLDFNARM